MALKPVKRKGSPYYHAHGTINGERIRESTKADNLKEAQDVCYLIEKRIRENQEEGLTFSHAIVEYVEHTGNNQYLKKINEVLGKTPLADMDQETIDKAARKAYPSYKKGPKGKMRSYKNSTIKRQFYTPVAAVLHHVHDLGWIPYIRVKMPKTERPAPQWATKDWFARFNEHASAELRAITTFLAGTGCRISETLNLRPQDVDLMNRSAMVRVTKNGAPREVYLPDFVIRAIAPYLTGERVFDMYRTRHNVNDDLRRTCKAAGIDYLSTHKVGSHTFATSLAKYQGMDAKALTETGRWKDPKSTYHYTHFIKREQAEKADALEELVG